MSIYDYDMFKTGVIKNTEFMINFQNIILEKYNIDILFSELLIEKYESRLEILVGNKDKELLNILKNNSHGQPLNYITDKYNNILDEFMNLYDKDNIIGKLYLYAHSFEQIALTVSLNRAKKSIIKHIYDLFEFHIDITLLPDNKYHFIFKNTDDYNYAKQNGFFERINKICRKYTEKYDVFNVLNENAITEFHDLLFASEQEKFALLRG